MFRINKQKCIACGICIANCPGATRLGSDGKAEIIDQDKLKQCGGESICPMGAIEKVSNEGEKTEQQALPSSPPSPPYEPPPAPSPYGLPPSGKRRLGRGRGPGWSGGKRRERRFGKGRGGW